MKRNTLESILARLQPDGTGCLVWTGGISDFGYGIVSWENRKARVHRLLYQLQVGPIPEGMEPDHVCRNRACGNVDHLEVVTRRENVRRGMAPAGINFRKTHCIRGHALEGSNVIPTSDGRRCRECKRAAQRLPEAGPTNGRKTHCIRGHPFDNENTYRGRGYRECRACKREAAHRYRARIAASPAA